MASTEDTVVPGKTRRDLYHAPNAVGSMLGQRLRGAPSGREIITRRRCRISTDILWSRRGTLYALSSPEDFEGREEQKPFCF